MKIFQSMEEVPAGYGPTVVSVGNFDGVHQAHRNVLRQVVRRAGELEAKPVAVTFEPHPARMLRPNSGMKLRGEPVSSSTIRKLLRDGRISRARHLLGRPFSILSTAGRGRGYGSKYTVPTINLSKYDELVAADGVYITRTRVGAECFDS